MQRVAGRGRVRRPSQNENQGCRALGHYGQGGALSSRPELQGGTLLSSGELEINLC